MPTSVAVPRETAPGERRVAMEPGVAKRLKGAGVEVLLETGAGAQAYLPDALFPEATIVGSAAEALSKAQVTLKVQPPSLEEVAALAEGSALISFMYPHKNLEVVKALAERRITTFAIELLPRISRAQAMDALSSQAAVGGYKAVLMAADLACRFFPMLTTAAGTIRPSTVVVIGAGVAGLQAIATARRLGAIVEAYDVRSATKEQVESLGATFIETGVAAEGEGGYARELTEEEKAKQAEVLANHIAKADAVVTTAAIPGRPAPKIIAQETVERMKAGAVIVDLAAEGGGNCAVTKPGETIEHAGVIVHGPLNVPSLMPLHASEMYAKNLYNLLQLLIKDGEYAPNMDDEVLKGALLTHQGEVTHAPTKDALA